MGIESGVYMSLVLFLETMMWKRARFWLQRQHARLIGYFVLKNERENTKKITYSIKRNINKV